MWFFWLHAPVMEQKKKKGPKKGKKEREKEE
jgi:hypothetical protein